MVCPSDILFYFIFPDFEHIQFDSMVAGSWVFDWLIYFTSVFVLTGAFSLVVVKFASIGFCIFELGWKFNFDMLPEYM